MASAPEVAGLVVPGDLWERQPTPGLPPGACLPAGESLVCRIDPAIEAAVVAHAAESPDSEIAGLLLGNVYEELGVRFVDVTSALRARHTDASIGHVTFTIATWLDLIERRERDGDRAVVGWYHSHPGHGVFLSGADRFIHEGFFGGGPWYLDMVIDPASGRQGVFTFGGREVMRCGTDKEKRSEE